MTFLFAVMLFIQRAGVNARQECGNYGGVIHYGFNFPRERRSLEKLAASVGHVNSALKSSSPRGILTSVATGAGPPLAKEVVRSCTDFTGNSVLSAENSACYGGHTQQ